MVFSDTTNKNGIIQQIEATTNLGDATISGDATLFAQITAQINNYYLKATKLIITADGRWRWDDTNMTNQPTATTNIVAGQNDYLVMEGSPSVTQDWLEVERVEFKNEGGVWGVLVPRNLRDVKYSITQERATAQGTPTYYDFDGSSVWLDQTPSYSSVGGLKIWFNRAPLLFATTDTTKRPGFNSLFHEYLVLGATYWWEKYRNVGNPEQTKRDLMEMEKEIAEFYGNRNQYEVNKVRRPIKSYK